MLPGQPIESGIVALGSLAEFSNLQSSTQLRRFPSISPIARMDDPSTPRPTANRTRVMLGTSQLEHWHSDAEPNREISS
jgi:hypothetical protein